MKRFEKPLITIASILILLVVFYVKIANGSELEQIGDTLQIAIPVCAFAATMAIEDHVGTKQFVKGFALNLASTYTLKWSIQRERPHGSATDSFPSGHTSSAFQGAGFIQQRYGDVIS